LIWGAGGDGASSPPAPRPSPPRARPLTDAPKPLSPAAAAAAAATMMVRAAARLAAAAIAAAAVAAAATAAPDVIPLPRGFRPEGIVALTSPYFAVGSLAGNGQLYVFNGVSGTGAEVFNTPNQTVVGLTYDRSARVLWAAGGPSGNVLAWGDQGATLLSTVPLPKGDADSVFANDAVVVPRAGVVAVTDSQAPALYLIPTAAACGGAAASSAVRVPLTGDFKQGPGFNANGIEWSRAARTLVLIQSNTGKLFRVGFDGRTAEIPVAGGPLTAGDGILFDAADRSVLYVVRNRLQTVAVVKFRNARRLTGARVARNITIDGADTPTTVAQGAGGLYLPDARFGTPDPDGASYAVYRVDAATRGVGAAPKCGQRRRV